MSLEHFELGLNAPICLTWELTYACNLSCKHCLSASGKRRPNELTFAEITNLVDEWAVLGVFYVNIGGGEPMIRRDFFDVIKYTVDKRIGVKFSTNGTFINAESAHRIAEMDYVDLQISLDGVDAATNDAIRGPGAHAAALLAMDNLVTAGFDDFKISVVLTRHSIPQLNQLQKLADAYGARLRLTRLRPSGRGVDVWNGLRPTHSQQRQLHSWLLEHPGVLTGDSLFHLNAIGKQLPGLAMCGAGRIVCLVDPVGDVYACPFLLHPDFKAGNVRSTGGFTRIWRQSDLFAGLRTPTVPEGACRSCGSFSVCQGGCIAAKVAAGSSLAGPDPECVYADEELVARMVPIPMPLSAGAASYR